MPLLVIACSTNHQYIPVLYGLLQNEKEHMFSEALQILKMWNPNWSPSFIINDYSNAQINALKRNFPTSKIKICEFHRKQSVKRWIRKSKLIFIYEIYLSAYIIDIFKFQKYISLINQLIKRCQRIGP